MRLLRKFNFVVKRFLTRNKMFLAYLSKFVRRLSILLNFFEKKDSIKYKMLQDLYLEVSLILFKYKVNFKHIINKFRKIIKNK